MRIINQSKNKILADRAALAKGLFERVKGLLGKNELKPGEALVIPNCNSVHTFFMRFPIDLIFLDKRNNVVKIIRSMPPFRITKVYFKASLVIELPSGILDESLCRMGDNILIK